MEHPNILYLHCHDAGRWIEPYGYPVSTPNLSRLAREGTVFRQAHCGNPTCSPSRACLLTGQSAHTAGMFGLAHRGWRLRDYSKTMMQFLRGHGYETVLCGQQHLANPPFADYADPGYDRVLTVDSGTELAPRMAEDFLARRDGERPFFLDVGFHAPHRAGPTGDFSRLFGPEDERYVAPPPPLPDLPETRRDFALFAASMRSADFAMGRVLDALERHGHADNTLIICTTDHGPAFPGMKCRLTDHGTGVMLLMRGPGGFEGGKVIDAMVSQTDVFPTVCEVLGVATPEWVEGRSFLPVVRGDASAARDELFAEVNYHGAFEPMRSVRTRRWKYIRHAEGPRGKRAVLANIDNGLSKLALYDAGLGERLEGGGELYDLVFDPQESNNLAGDPEHEAVRRDLSERLDRWMRERGDYFPDGEPPTAEGMVTTNRDAYDPQGRSEPDREALPWTRELAARSPHAPKAQRSPERSAEAARS